MGTLGSDPTCAPELRFGGCDSCDDATCRNLTQPKTCEFNQPCPKADDGTTAARLGGNGALVTHMVMQFGQFVAHSFSMTSQAELDCCNKDFGHEECFNIDISYDPYYKDKRWCHTFTRSHPFRAPGNHREQINAQSSFLDLDNVYGYDKNRT